MAICIHCQKTEKEFFAAACPLCTQETGFLLQCLASILCSMVYYGVMIGGLWLLGSLIF